MPRSYAAMRSAQSARSCLRACRIENAAERIDATPAKNAAMTSGFRPTHSTSLGGSPVVAPLGDDVPAL